MTSFEQWDVVVVPFPFVDLPVQKTRPALVLSTKVANHENGQTLLSMITTATRSHWPSDCDIEGLREAGLRTPSLVRFKLFTLPNTLIVRKIGHLVSADQTQSAQALKTLLNFD
ncbi:MAG: transcriptional regulator [Robiginitomaculum sp.]|nr:MAG: transcriptional regulator [Robiginitomaculum sp.]